MRYGIMTWTLNTPTHVGVVTAESCEVAKLILASRGITVTNTDLIPVVTHTRWARVLRHNPLGQEVAVNLPDPPSDSPDPTARELAQS